MVRPMGKTAAIDPVTGLLPTRAQRWFGFDLRSLAFFRVSLALIMIVDLYNRSPFLRAHYTDFGIMPRKVFVDGFMNQWLLSFHLMSDKPAYIATMFLIQAFFGLWLLVGFRTRLATFVCWAFTISLQARQPMILQAGDVLFRVMLFWAMFMPLGARYSVDAAMDRGQTKVPRYLLSIVTVAFMFQVFYAYWFVVGHRVTEFSWWDPEAGHPILKIAPEWAIGNGVRNLQAVYFAASIDHFATPLAKWLVQYPTVLKVLTWLTIVIEAFGPLLWFIPRWWAKFLCVLTFWGMHAGFGLVLEVGMFVFISASTWCCFVPAEVWDFLEDKLRGKRITILYDETGRARYKVLLALKTLLYLPRAIMVAYTADPDAEKLASGRKWAVRTEDGTLHVREDAVHQLYAASSWFWWLAWPMRATYFLYRGLDWLGRGKVLPWLGRRLVLKPIRWRYTWLTQVLAGFFFVYITLWNFDAVAGKKAKVEQRPLAVVCHPIMKVFYGDDIKMGTAHNRCKRLGWMLRIDQRWNMFSPYPMKGDGYFVHAGTLQDGRTLDVWRSIYPDVPREWDGWSFTKPSLSSTYYPGQRWRKYLMNIWLKKHKKHRLHFGRWICRAYNEGKKGGDRLLTHHLFYVKETTVIPSEEHPEGRKQRKCITLWRHWCTNKGKNDKVKPAYEVECKTYDGKKGSPEPPAIPYFED